MGNSRSKKSSGGTKSSSTFKSFTKLKFLEEKSKIAELDVEATFMLEKQKAENQAKMLQMQEEVARTKSRATVYEDYNQMKVNLDSEVVEVDPMCMRKRCNKDGGRANVEDNKSDFRVALKEKKSRSSAEGKPKAIRSGAVECVRVSNKKQPNMVTMMSKLLRQQAAPDVDINIFTKNAVDYHYFISVFDEVVEKKIDNP